MKTLRLASCLPIGISDLSSRQLPHYFHSTRSTRTFSSKAGHLHFNDRNLILKLPTGRQIGYSLYGDLHSYKHDIVYLHGLPGSRVEAYDLHPAALHHQARLISLDRPGYGLSTLHPGRTLSSYPTTDVLALVDHLGIDTFYIVGTSGGGPYALSCARHIDKKRLKGVAVIAGLAPFKHELPFSWSQKKSAQQAQKRHRALQRYMLRYLPNYTAQLSDSKYGALARHPNPEYLRSYFAERLAGYESTDAALFKSEAYINTMSGVIREVFKQGWKGYAEDGKLLHRKWGFELGDIEIDNVLFAHGGRDVDIPPQMGKAMSEAVKGSRYIEYRDETHASLLRVKGTEIIGELFAYQV